MPQAASGNYAISFVLNGNYISSPMFALKGGSGNTTSVITASGKSNSSSAMMGMMITTEAAEGAMSYALVALLPAMLLAFF
jgi:hypothetical protein